MSANKQLEYDKFYDWVILGLVIIATCIFMWGIIDFANDAKLAGEICFPYQVETYTEKAVFCNVLNGYESRPWEEKCTQ